jgi:hypothetical protein
VWCEKPAPSRLQPPPVLVKNRWVGPPRASIECTDHILVYRPSKPSSMSSTEAWLKPTALLAMRGRETWWGCRSVSRRVGDVVESPYFLGAVGSIQIYRWLVKGYYMWTTWDTYDRGSYVDRAWKACGVLVGFSLAECTSIRITVNLGYEYCLFVAVIT